jgi:hypothetical protein
VDLDGLQEERFLGKDDYWEMIIGIIGIIGNWESRGLHIIWHTKLVDMVFH